MSTDFSASNSAQNKSPTAQTSATLATVWTPSTLVRALSDALAARFSNIALSGEISGLTRAASGHWYFTLKDAGAQVRCAMFRGRNAYVDFKPQDGMQVKVRAAVNVYEPRGELQILVESMQQAGQGALYERFLLLKATLQAEGLFDPARKRAVLAVPRIIGVITSLQAAALRDVLTTLKRRAPHTHVLIFPASVQGAPAPQELLRALNAASASAADTLLLVRGGGSMEDLWAFNDAALARAIGQTRQPVISGVGHETDFTIADFVADLRAPTPTAAAELAATPLFDLQDQIDGMASDMRSAIERQLLRGQQRLDRAEIALAQLARRSDAALGQLKQLNLRLSYALHERTAHERNRVQSASQRLERQRLPARLLPEQHQRISTLAARLAQSAQTRLARHHSALQGLERTLQVLSPQRTLERGYSAVFGADGRAITATPELARQSRVRVRLADGELQLDVRPVDGRPNPPPGKPKPQDDSARQLSLE